MITLRFVPGYTRKDQIHIKIVNKVNIFILNNKIVNSRSLWNHQILRTENKRITKNTTK
jgi:hypothetical protein